jgi:iron complex outermembrane receptor protein
MKGTAYLALAAATALTPIATAPAHAQTAAAQDDGAIIVTARRIEENLQDVPISITVFDQGQLDNRNITNAVDLAAYTPSLTSNGRYGPDKSSFAIRGFSQDLNTQPTVGVYLAEVVAPRLSSNITSGNGAGVGDMFDLENVQVLKGPQGTLFGRNTTGGAILLVPRKPTAAFEGYVEGTYGSRDARRVQAVVNVPLADTFKVRVGVDRYKRDGYLNNRSGIGPDDFNDINFFAARLGLLAELTPSLENYTLFKFSKSDTNGMVSRMAYCNRGTVPDSTGSTSIVRGAVCAQVDQQIADGFGYYDVNNNHPDPFVEGTVWQVINTTTYDATDNLTIKNIVSYGEAKERYSFALSGDNIAFPFVWTNPGQNRAQGEQWTFTEEFQLQGNAANNRLTWQAGFYTEHSSPVRGKGGQEQVTSIFANCTDVYAFKCDPLSLFGGAFVIGNIGIARNVYYYRNYGLYAQATYDLTDQLSITGGIRNTWDWQKEHADNVRVAVSPDGPVGFSCSRAATPAGAGAELLYNEACTRTFVEKSSKPTWLVGVDFKPNEDMLLYAKYARGYRGGGINEANFGVETWNPETVDTYEIGYKMTLRGAVRGNLSVAGFWNEFTDQQTSVFISQCVSSDPGCTNPAPTGINGIQNVGKSRLRGVEVDGSLTFFDDLRLDFGYAYLDAKVTGGSVPFCDDTRFRCSEASFLTAGTVLPFAPKNRFTVTGTHTLPLDESIGDISIGATFTHTDKQFSGHGGDAAFAAGAIPFNASLSPATDLLNLNLNWKSVAGSPIDLALFATNVTKEKYYVASSNGLSTLGGDAVIIGEPRMYGVRLKVNFGD